MRWRNSRPSGTSAPSAIRHFGDLIHSDQFQSRHHQGGDGLQRAGLVRLDCRIAICGLVGRGRAGRNPRCTRKPRAIIGSSQQPPAVNGPLSVEGYELKDSARRSSVRKAFDAVYGGAVRIWSLRADRYPLLWTEPQTSQACLRRSGAAMHGFNDMSTWNRCANDQATALSLRSGAVWRRLKRPAANSRHSSRPSSTRGLGESPAYLMRHCRA